MASLLPKPLIGPSASLTTAVTTYASTNNTDTYGLVRNIVVAANVGSQTWTLAFGADAAATRQFALIPVNNGGLPSIVTGLWLPTAVNNAHALDMTSSDASGNQVIGSVGGYQFD